MRKLNFFLILLAVLVVSSCSKNETLDYEESKEQVNVDFGVQPDVAVSAGTRAAAASFVDPKKFSFYAFKKSGDTYSYAKTISDAAAAYHVEEKQWSSNSNNALLAVGTYRFLCLYNNVGDGQTLSGLENLTDKTWNDILSGIVIEHKAATADVDEFFSGESENGDVQITGITGNRIVVNFNILRRVTARIDVKFVKVTTDGKQEVLYSGTNSIFGAEDNLKSAKQTVKGLANKFNFGKASAETKWASDCSFAFNSLSNLVTLGTSAKNSTFPGAVIGTDINMDDTQAMTNGISKGGAYFRGAYVLPFMNAATTLENVKIELTEQNGGIRTIIAEKLLVQRNHVTLITVKLLSSTPPSAAPGESDKPGDGAVVGGGTGADADDLEHLFNPKLKFTVTIDTKYAGVDNEDVVVE